MSDKKEPNLSEINVIIHPLDLALNMKNSLLILLRFIDQKEGQGKQFTSKQLTLAAEQIEASYQSIAKHYEELFGKPAAQILEEHYKTAGAINTSEAIEPNLKASIDTEAPKQTILPSDHTKIH